MRKLTLILLLFALIFSLCLPSLAAERAFVSTATGYQDAGDVQYQFYTVSGKQIIANWGARGETSTFLTTYAENYYTGNYTWDTMSQLSGGTSTGNTPSSDLYKQLQKLMSSTHTFYTYYDGSKNVRDYYKYTDCVGSDVSKVGLLYLGTMVSSTWDGGSTWNQEHVWPKSKLSTDKQIGDIMHLRPANPSENSRRSNTAYGESSGYYTPNAAVRGDCARMVLYMYVRWGVTGTMWGSSGVIENLNILLKWMEEDPVDTWEMGRNDSVQSVTGVRNVFVDYPEYAWLMFGKEIPEDMTTPSGNGGNYCRHSQTQIRDAAHAGCTESGYTGDTYCLDCGERIQVGTTIPAYGHLRTELQNYAAGTCTESGYTGDTYCFDCDEYISYGTVIPASGHRHTEIRNKKDPTCGEDGNTGDLYCSDCQTIISEGIRRAATGKHDYSDWQASGTGNTQSRYCLVCGHIESQTNSSSCAHMSKYTVTVQPSCTEKGYGGNYCEKCNEYLGGGKEIPATGHQHTEVRNKTAAGCSSEGYTGDTWCTDCSTKTATGKVIPATGHQHTEIRNAKEATCGEEGYTGDTWCTNCNTKISAGQDIPATGNHNFTDWMYPPGGNQQQRYCLTCGHTESGAALPSCDHVAQYVITVPPTCTTAGCGGNFCEKCGDYLGGSQDIPATGHMSTEVRNAAEATCVADGYTGDTYCTDCGTKTAEGEAIPAAGHKNAEIRNAKEATCGEEGYTGDTYCTDCGVKTAEGEAIPPTGHKNTEIRNAKEATCGEEGYTGDTYCTDCSTKIAGGEAIATTEHKNTVLQNQTDASCTDPGYSGDLCCLDCSTTLSVGAPIPATGHQHMELRNKTDANCTADGYTGDTYCTDCGNKTAEGEVIPATGHLHTQIRGKKDATCAEAGSEGDTWCIDCSTKLADGKALPATGNHIYGPIAPGGEYQTYQECTLCGHRVVIDLNHDRPGTDWVAISIAAAVAIIAGGGIAAIVILKKRKP